MAQKTYLNPVGLPDWSSSFSQVVSVDQVSRLIFISGQVGYDAQNRPIAVGDLSAQAIKAFENLRAALAAAGAGPQDVVHLNIYVVNYQPGFSTSAVREAFRQVFDAAPLPTATWLGVQSLALAEMLIEVDAIAVI